MTGQQIVALALRRYGGPAPLAKRIRMRELSEAADVAKPLSRWGDPDGPRVPGDVLLRILDDLGAVNWKALETLRESTATGDVRETVNDLREQAESTLKKARRKDGSASRRNTVIATSKHSNAARSSSFSMRRNTQAPSRTMTSDSTRILTYVLPLATAAACVLVLAAPAWGQWKPGAAYYTSAVTVQTVLQRTVDFAACRGVQRFGSLGNPPTWFVVWDCTTRLDGRRCSGVRVRSVRAQRRGAVRLVTIRNGTCRTAS